MFSRESEKTANPSFWRPPPDKWNTELWRVLVDPGQIDQVIMNLVINPRDAMPKGGKLTIATANTQLDEFQVRKYIGAKPGAYFLQKPFTPEE
jgi:signal transduction histidine kinase